MKPSLPQGILKYLGAVAIAFSTGMADPGPSLLKVPADVLGDVVDEVEEAPWNGRHRQPLLELLSHDPRPAVRARVAERLHALWPDAADGAENLLRALAQDSAGEVRESAVRGLERVLDAASPLERITLVAEWASSEVAAERAAIAGALRSTIPICISDLAVAQLAADEAVEVRLRAIEAIVSHFHEAPRLYTEVLDHLVADPDPAIRKRARWAAQRLDIG